MLCLGRLLIGKEVYCVPQQPADQLWLPQGTSTLVSVGLVLLIMTVAVLLNPVRLPTKDAALQTGVAVIEGVKPVEGVDVRLAVRLVLAELLGVALMVLLALAPTDKVLVSDVVGDWLGVTEEVGLLEGVTDAVADGGTYFHLRVYVPTR